MSIKIKMRVEQINNVDIQARIDPDKPHVKENLKAIQAKSIMFVPAGVNSPARKINSKVWPSSHMGRFMLNQIDPKVAANFEVGKEYDVEIKLPKKKSDGN